MEVNGECRGLVEITLQTLGYFCTLTQACMVGIISQNCYPDLMTMVCGCTQFLVTIYVWHLQEWSTGSHMNGLPGITVSFTEVCCPASATISNYWLVQLLLVTG